MNTLDFKKWLVETATSSASIAGFARPLGSGSPCSCDDDKKKKKKHCDSKCIPMLNGMIY